MVSVDGFFEGLNHDLSWHNVDKEFDEFTIEQLGEIDTILFGRRTYEMMESFWPTEQAKKSDPIVAEKMNNLPKFVFSKTLSAANWNNATLHKENVTEEIKRLKEKEGREIAVFGSSDLCVSLLKAELLDELRIMVNPVVLGEGKRLFEGLDGKLKLKLLSTRKFGNGNILNYYKVLYL